MKKLLSLLSVLTISGSAMPTTIAASPYQKENKKILNSELNKTYVKRFKRENNNKLETWYCFLCHDRLVAKISHDTWTDIAFNHDLKISSEFYNYVFDLINRFEKRNSSGDTLIQENYWQDDVKILAETIVNHFEDINKVFENKNDKNLGLFIRTNRDSYWENNSEFWGAHTNN